MFTAWDTWYEPKVSCYVTGTIIACGRRSQEELYDRIQLLDNATTEIFRCIQPSLETDRYPCLFPSLLTLYDYIRR